MTESNIDTGTLAHLQSLDQCGYDLLEIIKAHSTEPVDIDKELEGYFRKKLMELESLIRKTPSIVVELSTIPCLPSIYLFSDNSERSKKDLMEVTIPLKRFLSDVRSIRRGLGVVPHTGIRDEELSKYLAGVYERKGVLSKLFKKPSSPTKIVISFDHKKGFYRSDDQTLSYPIRKGSKRLKLIKLLCGATQSITVSAMKNSTKHHDSNLVIKEVGNINKLFRNKLKVFDDLIIHNETSGYLLNHDKFLIQNF